ncbi:XRE family transcriptional regulator [Methylobacterium sp. Leaf361]|uniref:helix-turn-helix domain-containing protein n=1 Tax=Methylobacterium sp. Leaf361 TaxID=1736352 RepID=UPI0006FA64C9|nr:helix-turn-helix transcriptional regulator [Methylobacterium sp. Leaf361]KQS82161.1 XRE family transcriptional regulator [Methylobacterium sp. Leaf361]
MRLADFLADRGIKDSDFAETIGVSRMTLWRYKSGDRRPEWDVLKRIVQATEGHVTPNDFLDAQAEAEAAQPPVEGAAA